VNRLFVALALPAAAAAMLSGCTSNKAPTITTDTTITQKVTSTRPPPAPSFKAQRATSVAPLPPGAAPAVGEVEKACPYILSSQNQGENSLADLEGDRVYRTTVLTKLVPVGCRFYFWSGPYEAIAEIAPRRFATAQEAHDAMILTAQTGTQVQGYPNLLPGIDAVSYRTAFFGPDGPSDWACVFAKGKTMVVVRTQRKDTSFNARLIAKAIAPKF
jgi:hypothetical protein